MGKEGRLELYKMELDKKSKKFLAREKKYRGRSPDTVKLDKTRAFKLVDETPSPQLEYEYDQDPEDGDEQNMDEEVEDNKEEEELEEEVEKTPEPDDGLDPVTRAKNRVAEVVSKINNIPKPENYKPEPDALELIRPESELKEKPVLVGGYFARVVTEEELRRYDSRSRSNSPSRRKRGRRSRSKRRSRSRSKKRNSRSKRSRSKNRGRRSKSSDNRKSLSKGRDKRRSRSKKKSATPEATKGKGVEQENVIDSTGEKIHDMFADESPKNQTIDKDFEKSKPREKSGSRGLHRSQSRDKKRSKSH